MSESIAQTLLELQQASDERSLCSLRGCNIIQTIRLKDVISEKTNISVLIVILRIYFKNYHCLCFWKVFISKYISK